MQEQKLPNLEDLVVTSEPARRVAQQSPGAFAAAAGFWRCAFEGRHLTPRMKELVLLALHASPTTLNTEGIVRHVERALAAGASEADVLDVLLSIVGVANHALYFAVPVLVDELDKAAGEAQALPPLDAECEAIRQDFIRTRGFWNDQRDQLARLMPGYFKALSTVSMEPWKSGSLTPKERELVYIAIDCSVTHMFEFGLRLHIRHALAQGATREEILETFQLAALMGMEGYVQGFAALAGVRA